MDSVKIATRTASKGAVIEAATMDAVDVEVVLAEVGAAIVMTATLVVFPTTTSSKPTNHGAHLPASPNGKTNKQGKLSPKRKKKTKVQLADGMLAPPQEVAGIPAPRRYPLTQLPQLTLTVPLRQRDLLPPMLQPNQLRSLSLRTTAALTPTTSPSKRRRN